MRRFRFITRTLVEAINNRIDAISLHLETRLAAISVARLEMFAATITTEIERRKS